MVFMFLPYFQQSDKILYQKSVFLVVFEIVGSVFQLDQSLLACTDTRHQTHISK